VVVPAAPGAALEGLHGFPLDRFCAESQSVGRSPKTEERKGPPDTGAPTRRSAWCAGKARAAGKGQGPADSCRALPHDVSQSPTCAGWCEWPNSASVSHASRGAGSCRQGWELRTVDRCRCWARPTFPAAPLTSKSREQQAQRRGSTATSTGSSDSRSTSIDSVHHDWEQREPRERKRTLSPLPPTHQGPSEESP